MASPESAGVQDLLREVRELRETVAALRQRVTLRSLQEGPFLGQPVNVVAAVVGANGEPRVNVPVTFTTTWGRLRAVEDLRLRVASGVTVRTDGEGRARVVLLPPASEDVTAVQQDALETALRPLDRSAPAPEAAAGGLRELARQYRLDGSAELRRAIDLYLQDFGQRWRESFESRVFAVWPAFDTTVFAFARDADPEDEDVLDTSVLATAALPLRFKDWLGPWMQALAQVMAEDDSLPGDLRDARVRFQQPEALVGHLWGRVQLFLDNQKGIAGELAGRRAAEATLRGFLDDGLPEVPAGVRSGVVQGVEVAAGTLKATGAGVLAAVGQTRQELTKTVDRKIAEVPKVDLTGVTGRIDQIAGQIATKADLAAVNGLRGEITTSLAGKADRTALDTLSTNFNRDLGRLNDRLGQLGTVVTKFSTDLTAFNADLGAKIATKAEAAAVEGLRGEFTTSLAAKADRTALDALNTNVTKDITSLKERSTQLDQRVTTLNTSVGRIDTTLKDPRIIGRFNPPG